MVEAGESGRGDKRGVILRAARELFLAHGFEGTSVDAVTAAAGVSKPTVYAHFGTKEALLDAVVAAEVKAKSQPSAFEASGDARSDLERLAALLLRLALSPESLAWDRVMAGEARRRPEVGRVFYEGGPAHVLSGLTGFFRDHHWSGVLVVPDPEQAADFFVGLTLGVPLMRGQLCGEAPTEAEIAARSREVAARFLRAYAPPERG